MIVRRLSMDQFTYIVSQPFPILFVQPDEVRGRREEGDVALGAPAKNRVLACSAHLVTLLCSTARAGMRVGALCLSLCDLALHRPPYTCLETRSCGSVFSLTSPTHARSFDQGWSQRETLLVPKSKCPHLPGLRVMYAGVNQAFAVHFRGCRSNFMTALCVCPWYYTCGRHHHDELAVMSR